MKGGSRPKFVKYEKSFLDQFVFWMGILGLVILIITPLAYWSDLPDVIPTHFNGAGEPDGFGDKLSIVFMPILGAGIWGLLFFLSQKPEIHNYPVAITTRNAQGLYKTSIQLLTLINFIVISVFAYINYRTIQIAIGLKEGLHPYFGGIFIALIIAVVVIYYLKFKKSGRLAR